MPVGCTRDDLSRGLDLARSLCEVSSSSRRLLRSFSRLKELISRLGVDTLQPIERGNTLPTINVLAETITSRATLAQRLTLEQEFDFSFLFEEDESTNPSNLIGLEIPTEFGSQVAGDIYDGIQDYAWIFQDF